MSTGCTSRGGAPVGLVSDLGAAEILAVLYLRLWSDSDRGRDEVALALARGLGEAQGEAAVLAFDALFDLCCRYGRRPLLHHNVTCRCLGADEACFANFVVGAAEGEREDAILMATLLVRADAAPMLAEIACDVGLALCRMALRGGSDRAASINPKHLH